MAGKGNISDYRSKLDKTLASPDLTNYETVRTLVKNQILRSSESKLEEYIDDVVEKRSKEMSNFISMLRSASVNDFAKPKSINESQSGWKIKEDTDEFRVMYREGPAGTPLHTLLVEGYVDGPLDVCLCISCESDLYNRWWPQSAIPTFKVVQSRCVQKVGIGEQISLVRMKLSWPLSSREALVHFFALEYFQDGLIVVLLNSISDLESIEKSTHGFMRDGIPDAEDVVRIDVVGGFALQKVSECRSYFRTIANMDIKLDFVPPAFINFISRQLVGSGFKLYKKEIASLSKHNNIFREALMDPVYTRIHEALYSQNTPLPSRAPQNLQISSTMLDEQNEPDNLRAGERKSANESEEREYGLKSFDATTEVITEEVETDEKEAVITKEMTDGTTKLFASENDNKIGIISPSVREALVTLDKAILLFREHSNNNNNNNDNNNNNNNNNNREGRPDVENGHLRNFDEENGEEMFISFEADQIRKKDEVLGEPSGIGSTEKEHQPKNSSDSHGSRLGGSNSHTKETNQSKIAPDDSPTNPHSPAEQITSSTIFEKVTENHKSLNGDAKIAKGEKLSKRKRRMLKFCCTVAQ